MQPSVETGPARALRVLLVEDSAEDAVLVVRFLARGPFQVQHTRVQDGAALLAALAEQRFDVVLCDFELPTLDAFEALAIVRGQDETCPSSWSRGGSGRTSRSRWCDAGPMTTC